MLNEIRKNPLLLTDSYNLSHQRLKINVDFEVSHMYNRNAGMILYGLNEIINSVLTIQITSEMIEEAEMLSKNMGIIFPSELFRSVIHDCNGYFPLKIQSLPEGMYCPAGTPFAQIRNTVEGYGELVSWLEGVFMMAYFPSACATEAFKMRKYLEIKKNQYGYDDSFFERFFSYGFRGSRSLEDAYWAGVSWNLFLHCTDDFHSSLHTPAANIKAISATAHKVIQQFDDEYEAFLHAIKVTSEANEKIVGLVIDTYDAYRVINEYLLSLAEYAQELGVHIVFRPDSGDTWEQTLRIYQICKKNELNNISVLIGEAIDFKTAKECDKFLEHNKIPLSFVSYGIGGGFYGKINRDTLGWAMKTAYSNGKPRMKFCENPAKSSIPNKVIVKKEKDKLMVDIEKYEGQPSKYKDIYYHDNLLKKPLYNDITKDHWLKVQKLGLVQEMTQERIVVTNDIIKTILEIKKNNKVKNRSLIESIS